MNSQPCGLESITGLKLLCHDFKIIIILCSLLVSVLLSMFGAVFSVIMYILQCRPTVAMRVHVVKCRLYSVSDTRNSSRQLVTLCDGQQVHYNAHVG